MKKTLLSAIALAIVAVSAQAATITWGTPTWIAGDTDVSTLGTTFAAINPAGSSETINTVTFEPTDPNLQVSGGAGWSDFITGTPSLNLIPATGSYSNALETANYSNGGLAIYNLTVGQDYLVQVWASDAREGGGTPVGGRSMTLDGGAVSLLHNHNDGTSTFGQWVIGTFTANSTNQTITASGYPQIDLAQVRTVPEPATLSMLGVLGGLLFFARRRFKR